MSFIKFLGTAGARFVMIRQLRSSGGIWLNFQSTNICIDPGPGAIVRCNAVRPRLDPTSLDAVILTHKHLDHSGDVNVMIEAMTEGGFKKRGVLFSPADSIGADGVVFPYVLKYLGSRIVLEPGEYTLKDVRFSVPVRNLHSVETYGLKFFLGDEVVSFVSDTRYFDGLIDAYRGSTILVVNVVFYQAREEYDHLCLEEALALIEAVKPKKAVLTHFGMGMLRAKPHILEERVRRAFACVTFARDGFRLDLPILGAPDSM